MLSIEQLFLIIVWAVLAFVVQPYYITIRISAKYKDKEWVKLNLALSHETLMERLNTVLLPLFHDELTTVVRSHLQTFKASLMQGPNRDAAALNGEVEEMVDGHFEEQIGLPPAIMEEATEKIMKKYPSLALVLPLLKAQNNGSGSGILPSSGGRGGGDF